MVSHPNLSSPMFPDGDSGTQGIPFVSGTVITRTPLSYVNAELGGAKYALEGKCHIGVFLVLIDMQMCLKECRHLPQFEVAQEAT